MIVQKLDLFPTRVVVIEDFLTNNEMEKFHAVMSHLEPSGSNGHNGIYLRDQKNNFKTDEIDFFYDKTVQVTKEHYKVDVEVFESIYNLMDQGQSLLIHHHVNLADWESSTLRTFSVLTGCYYTNNGEGFAKLRFNNPQLLSRFIGEQSALNFQPKPNSLVLFPSWTLHGTTTHESNVTRKCLVMEMTLK